VLDPVGILIELEDTFLSSEYKNYKISDKYLGISTLLNPFDDKIWFNILFSFLSVLATSILIDYFQSNTYSSSFHFVRRISSLFWHYFASILKQCKSH
jgi:hypothetical protein